MTISYRNGKSVNIDNKSDIINNYIDTPSGVKGYLTFL